MLVIYKGNMVLKVELAYNHIRIQPVVGPFDNPQLLQVLARNEELLAQVHWSHSKAEDPLMDLAHYFEQKGWLVRRSGQTPPAAQDSPWADS